MLQPTTRFSSRVDNYVRYRPHYPAEVLQLLTEECGLNPDWIIADLGSGTGFSSELFLQNGNAVFGVEPNREMREAGEQLLKDELKFTSINGTAEATTLPDESIDLIIAGQAFHWFDVEATRVECQRIIKPGGRIALIWNERRVADDPLQAEYEAFLLKFGTDYENVGLKHKVDESSFDTFFGGEWATRECPNEQILDWDSFKGRVLSASYIPESDQPNYVEMLNALRALFDAHEKSGEVAFRYSTRIFVSCASS